MSRMSSIETTNRRLMRMGVAAHLEGVMNGIFLRNRWRLDRGETAGASEG